MDCPNRLVQRTYCQHCCKNKDDKILHNHNIQGIATETSLREIEFKQTRKDYKTCFDLSRQVFEKYESLILLCE